MAIKTQTEFFTVKGGKKYKGIQADKLFGNIPLYITKAGKKGIINTGLEVFEKSMRKVPVDTGKLARSGKVAVNDEMYAKGECPSTFNGTKEIGGDTSVAVVKRDQGTTPNAEDKELFNSGKIELEISFQRTGDNDVGLDVALWTHEVLLPGGSGPYHARRPGTSGKYLEAPLNETSDQLLENVKNEIAEIIKHIK